MKIGSVLVFLTLFGSVFCSAWARADSIDDLRTTRDSGICPANPMRHKLISWDDAGCVSPQTDSDDDHNKFMACVEQNEKDNQAIISYNEFLDRCERAFPKPKTVSPEEWAPRIQRAREKADAPEQQAVEKEAQGLRDNPTGASEPLQPSEQTPDSPQTPSTDDDGSSTAPSDQEAKQPSWEDQFCEAGVQVVNSCVFEQNGCSAGSIQTCWNVCGLSHYVKGGDRCPCGHRSSAASRGSSNWRDASRGR